MNWFLASIAGLAILSAWFLKIRRFRFSAVAVAVITIGTIAVRLVEPPTEFSSVDADLPILDRAGYAASDACQDCHPNEHASWYRSFHRTMTQVATVNSVIPSFDNVRLHAHQRTYHLREKGDELWVDMPNPEWEEAMMRHGVDLADVEPPRIQSRIVMATGSHKMQTFWLPTRRGNQLRQLPWIYDISDQRWLPNMDSFIRPPASDSELLATQLSVHWNTACIRCHAVAGYTEGTHDRWETRVAELGIACEACHGAGEKHVQYHRSGKRGPPPERLINPADCDTATASQVCAQCHSDSDRRQQDQYRPGDDLLQAIRVYDHQSTRSPDRYWPDGTLRIGGREFNAMVASKCHLNGDLSCLSCHSMHQSQPDGQLADGMKTNAACLQCHESYGDQIESHTHHPAGSSGSECYNCHMPYTSYALLRAIRSHRIDSPKISLTAQGRLNACNMCHLDKSRSWTAKFLAKWYDAKTPPLASADGQSSAAVMQLLRGDAVQRAILGDVFGSEMARAASGRHWQAPLLAQLLDDPYSAVRYIGYRSLKKSPRFASFEYDFMDDAGDRAAALARATKMWNDQSSPDWLPGELAVFFTQQGTLDQRKVDAVMRERDDTPLELSE